MNLQLLVDEDNLKTAIANLRCSVCENHLSYSPIYLRRNQNVCGRCATRDELTRNIIYESLATCVAFPCCYKNQGCDEQLFMSEVPDHELFCKFRTMTCLLENCDWEGAMSNFDHHCIFDHADLIIQSKQEFEIDLKSSYEATRFYRCNMTIYPVLWQYNFGTKKLDFLVLDHYDTAYTPKTTDCILTVQSKIQDNVFSSTRFVTDVITKIFCQDLFKDEISLIANINLQYSGLVNEGVNFKLLVLLKCIECSNYILPPIYEIQSSGELICFNCTQKSKAKTKVNHNLSNLVQPLLYPCINSESGCLVELCPFQMNDHQKHCPYNEFVCTLKIKKGATCKHICQPGDYLNHLKSSHKVEENNDFRWNINQDYSVLLVRFKYYVLQLSYSFLNNELNFFVKKVFDLDDGSFKIRFCLISYEKKKTPIIKEAFCKDHKAVTILRMKADEDYLEKSTNQKLFVHFKIDFFRVFS